jgi:solute carrier family 25 citrate transporter 1
MASAAQTPATSAPLPPPALPKITGTVSKGKQREKPIASLLAGATAGAIEGFVTYPTEFAKTQLQFAGRNSAVGSAVVKVSYCNLPG